MIVERASTARADEDKFSPNRNCRDEDKIAKTFPSAASSSSDGCKRILRCPVYFHHIMFVRFAAQLHAAWGASIANVISAPLWAGGGAAAAALDALGHRGRTGLAHKCLQTPLTFARSLIPLDLCSAAAAHYKRATAAATCEYVCRRSYDKKGRDDCGPRSSPFRFTNSQIGGRRTDRPTDR